MPDRVNCRTIDIGMQPEMMCKRRVSILIFCLMCCLHPSMLTQGSTCLEVGVYMLNYAGCHACKSKSFIDAADKSREEEEGGSEENITYKRMCHRLQSAFVALVHV